MKIELVTNAHKNKFSEHIRNSVKLSETLQTSQKLINK